MRLLSESLKGEETGDGLGSGGGTARWAAGVRDQKQPHTTPPAHHRHEPRSESGQVQDLRASLPQELKTSHSQGTGPTGDRSQEPAVSQNLRKKFWSGLFSFLLPKWPPCRVEKKRARGPSGRSQRKPEAPSTDKTKQTNKKTHSPLWLPSIPSPGHRTPLFIRGKIQ